MAHYALLDENNIVTQVITGKNEDEQRDGVDVNWEEWYRDFVGAADCKRTSYNTQANQHLLGGTPFRKNFAGIGYKYDQTRDAFIPPKPFSSWILNEETCLWEAPVNQPELTQEQRDNNNYYEWNETNQNWDLKE